LSLSQAIGAGNLLSDKSTSTSELIALALGSVGDDGWYIDNRSILSLSLTKETYEHLGLIGTQRMEGHCAKFLVQINLHDRTSKQFSKAKASIKLWDERRSASKQLAWTVAFHTSNQDILKLWSPSSKESQVPCAVHRLPNIIIPKSPMVVPPPCEGPDKEDRLEDWNSSVADLFEWVGMACLHSQRLLANDRVHSYVSSYQPPQDHFISDATHICWRGLLAPRFVKAVLDTITLNVSKPNAQSISAVCHTFNYSPISYISPKALTQKIPQTYSSNNVPQRRVDCWSLVIDVDPCRWVLTSVESH